VPMYEQQRLKECEYILSDSGAKLLLVSKERIYDKASGPVRLSNKMTTPQHKLKPRFPNPPPPHQQPPRQTQKQTKEFVDLLPALTDVWCFDIDFAARLKVRWWW
jgi:long-subunit acyl-CoA synthetase (AMP-forming)